MNSIKDKININEIEKMDFSTLVAIVREPNMCSGGYETIRTIVKEVSLPNNANILEIGSNTGFSCIEFAQIMPNSNVIGIDINPISVEFAKDKAANSAIRNVKFQVANALELPYSDETFDLVFVSNVTSFIDEKEKAIAEYQRVLKRGGYLVAAPIYYLENPPKEIIYQVEQAIGTKLDTSGKKFWYEHFSSETLKLYFDKDYRYIKSTSKEIADYIEMVFSQEHLKCMELEVVGALMKRLQYFYELFDDNLSYAGFSILIYRNLPANMEPMLHKTCEV